MGEFVGYRCNYCGYKESQLPVGKGRDPDKEVKLFLCASCKSVHSTWVGNDTEARCSLCYDRDIKLLEPVAQQLTCPKCDAAGAVTVEPGSWE